MIKVCWGIILAFMVACTKQPVYAPVGEILSKTDLNISQNRSKSLNDLERKQIQDWINQQDATFYPMTANYWTDNKALLTNDRRKDGEKVSYQYELYDFDNVKIYNHPKVSKDVYLGKFEEIKAVDNALRHMKVGEEATLLVPSILAFGAYGDNDKIPNDMPLIIKLKRID